MRLVKWTDKGGFLRGAYVRDSDPDNMAGVAGIPHDPPDLSGLNWDAVARDLHNQLAQRGLFTWVDVQAAGDNGLVGAILSAMKNKLIALYRAQEV